MSAPIQTNIKLRDAVYSYQEQAKGNEAEFLRLWRLAFRGFKFMGLNGFWEPQTVELVVNANKTATFPADYIKWCKVGQLNAAGEFQTLAVNNNLTTYRDNGPNRLADITPEIQQALLGPYWMTGTGFYGPTDGEWAGNQQNFGLGSHLIQPGEFKIDETNRVIILNTNYPYPNVWLMYLSAPIQNMDYEIPMQFEEAMIAWLAWKDTQFMPANSHMAGNDKQMRARDFARAVSLSKKMYKPFNLAEAEQYYRESFLWGVKG